MARYQSDMQYIVYKHFVNSFICLCIRLCYKTGVILDAVYRKLLSIWNIHMF